MKCKQVLRKIFGQSNDEVNGEWRIYIMRNLIIYTANLIHLCSKIKKAMMACIFMSDGGNKKCIQT
jgi:hypothetical protein